MNIVLTPESEQKIKDEVSLGIYPDANTFVNDAIARAAEADREKLHKLREALIEGEESGVANNFNIDDFMAHMHEKHT